MSETLKPCPFCGGEVRIRQHVDDRGNKGEWISECLSHDCRLWEYSSPTTKQEAIAAWNHRHVSPAARHIAEKIRQSIKAESVMVYGVFGKKIVKVMLDLDMAEEFAKEVGDGTK